MKKIRNEQGYVLASGLILLLIITLLALYGIGNSISEEKIAGVLSDRDIALQNAEKALRVAEASIYSNINVNSGFSATCAAGLCTPNLTTPNWQSIAWDTNTANTISLSGSNVIPGATKQPKYIIEILDSVPPPPGESAKTVNNASSATAYRITTVAWGNKAGTKVMLQSVYVKR